MSQSEAFHSPMQILRFPMRLLSNIAMFAIRAALGSLLSICTSFVFAIFGLIVFADMPPDLATTFVALGMNGMLLTLIALGNLPENQKR